jgi:hypothetical protein
MKPIMLLWAGVLLLPLFGCEDVGLVDKAKYDQLAKENVDLKKQLAEKEDEIKKIPNHHYSLHREGLRTFRFDADTGQTCIQLTTPEDWKKTDTKRQSCDCQDLISEGGGVGSGDDPVRKMYCGW